MRRKVFLLNSLTGSKREKKKKTSNHPAKDTIGNTARSPPIDSAHAASGYNTFFASPPFLALTPPSGGIPWQGGYYYGAIQTPALSSSTLGATPRVTFFILFYF